MTETVVVTPDQIQPDDAALKSAETFLRTPLASEMVLKQENFDRITASMRELNLPMSEGGFRMGFLDAQAKGLLELKPKPVPPAPSVAPVIVPEPLKLKGRDRGERLAIIGVQADPRMSAADRRAEEAEKVRKTRESRDAIEARRTEYEQKKAREVAPATVYFEGGPHHGKINHLATADALRKAKK